MKKTAIIAVSTVLILGIFSGCGNSNDTERKSFDNSKIYTDSDADYENDFNSNNSDSTRSEILTSLTEDITKEQNVDYIPEETEIYLGGMHSAAIMSNGDLYIWGNNSAGQIGDGEGELYSAVRAPKKIMSNVKSVCIGNSTHRIHCSAQTENGELYFWGDNTYSQLGNGSIEGSSTPIVVSIPKIDE